MTEPGAESVVSRVGASWRAAFRDIVLIVVSIVIAFGLDAWWDNTTARRRAARHADELAAEFTVIQEQLRADQREVDIAEVATRELLDAFAGETLGLGADSIARLFFLSWSAAAARPEGGALLAILGSGATGDLADDTLSQLLAQWPVISAEVQRQNQLLTDNREGPVMTRLRELGVPERRIAATGAAGLEVGLFPFNLDAVLGDVALESTLVARLIRLLNLRNALLSADEHSQRILHRLVGD